MKDFDAERQEKASATLEDRDFKIGGEHFRAKASVRPEVLVGLSKIQDMSDFEEILVTIDEAILAMVEPNDDAFARYRAVREREDDPVGLDDLQDIALWLMEAYTGRPTEQPGGSSAGPGSTGTLSTDTSSSPDSPAEPEA